MQSWIQELRQLGPPNLVLAIAGNKLDIDENRQVSSVSLTVNQRRKYEGYKTVFRCRVTFLMHAY